MTRHNKQITLRRVVHGYDSVDYNRVWQILQQDMPSLINELEKLNLPDFR